MAKTFRSWDVDQSWRLPASVHDFVPSGHQAHFVRDTAREALDLSAILDIYTEERGYPPYHPGMMVALLLYGYSRGLYSSRQLARACEEGVDVMAVTRLNRPDFRTIADFRKRHLSALSDLFVQVLRLCQAAGLVQFGHVAVDGTKLKANAEDHAHGLEWRGDEMPGWMADKQCRLEAIRAAKAALEAEAAEPPDPDDESGPGASSGMRWQGRALRGEDGGPPDRAQRNFTDPDSRILPTRDGFIQGYNGQIAVDAAHQIIVAHRLVTTSADYRALVPLVDDVSTHLGRKPREVSGDAGFATEANLTAMKERRIKPYLPPGRARHGVAHAAGRRRLPKTPMMSEMAETLRRAGRRSRYRLRKQVVEPVFGQIKQARGFRQFLLRGLDHVQAEWAMICTAHNLLKLAKNGH
ncbi:transposase [Bosea sp. 2KB_26]|uniref:transposase n=1 Tax=Bosea sp. 2KB_26 TaxID=3237475 RepID=UPI003F92D836